MIDRRGFLCTAGALSISAAVPAVAAEAPSETRRIRIPFTAALCFAPLVVAGEGLLQVEGFTQLSYPQTTDGRSIAGLISDGLADFGAIDVSSTLVALDKDKGQNLVVLGGLHAGCYELFASDAVRSIRDLKRKQIAIPGLHSGRHLTMVSVLAHIGIDASKEVTWVTQPPTESMRLLAEGKVDAYLGFPPEPQELRARKIGHLIFSMTTDRPWSEHYCCVIIARREYVKANPVASKRALRAVLKAAALCASEPERATRVLVERKLTDKYDYALTMMKELPYSRWRDYDPIASMRFYALRLHEAGMIRTTPQKLIAQGCDFRFIDELKRELKA